METPQSAGVRIRTSTTLQFFSFQDYRQLVTGASGQQIANSRFLTLGETSGEWHSKIKRLVQAHYNKGLQTAAQVYQDNTGKNLSLRQVEILFGHLVRILVWRILRSRAQLESADKNPDLSLEIPDLTLPGLVPSSSLQALLAAASREVGVFIDAAVANREFNLGIDKTFETHSKTVALTPMTWLESSYVFFARRNARISRNSNVLIQASYLGRIREALLSLMLLKPPGLNDFFEPQRYPAVPLRADWSLRTNLPLIRTLLENLMPSALLESLETSREAFRLRGYPKKPDLIFTSNSFETDDVFKAYVAENLERSQYVVGQHGNNYGVAQFSEPNPEIRTSDCFISWGWTDGDKVVPLGVLKPLLRNRKSKPSSVLLILRDPLSLFTAADSNYVHAKYLQAVAKLADEMSRRGLEVKFKPHGVDRERTIRELLAINPRLSRSAFVKANLTIESRALRRTLPVFCYDSTGLIEHAIVNRFFLYFAADGLSHVNLAMRGNYEALAKAGHLFEDPVLCAERAWAIVKQGLHSPDPEAYKEFLRELARRPKWLTFKVAAQLRKPSSLKLLKGAS